MNSVISSILLVLVGLIVGIIVMFIVNFIRKNSASDKADRILEKARTEGEKIKKDYIAEAKEEANELKIKTDEEIKEKKAEIKETENRLLNREENIDKRDQNLQKRENLLDEKEKNLLDKQKDIQEQEANVEKLKEEQLKALEEISGYTKEKARELVMKKVEEKMSKEIASFQENIRKTFILFSVTPVIVTVFGAIIIFVFTWGTDLSATNRRDCQEIADETDIVLNDYYDMLDAIEDAVKKVLSEGYRTGDIMGQGGAGLTKVGTSQMGDLIAERI